MQKKRITAILGLVDRITYVTKFPAMEVNPEAQKLIVCLDLDDTLIDDNYKFELTFCDCIKTILEAFETRPPQIDDVLQRARELDNYKLENWEPKQAYSPARLHATWIETYESLALDQGVVVKDYVKMILQGLVQKNFDPPYYIIPGSVEALRELRDEHYPLHLITTGSPTVQLKKLQSTGLSKFFNEVHILDTFDKSEKLQELKYKYSKKRVVMIGNSMRSDINPALKVGVDAIYIPRGSWHKFLAEPLNPNFKKIDSISKLQTPLREIAAY